MIASAYNTLVAAEERIKELKASSTNPGEPTDPETPVVDEKDETIKKLKTTVIVLAIVAGVIALGFVAYVVFDIVRKNKAVCAEAKEVEDKKEAGESSLEEVKDQIRAELSQKKQEEAYRAKVDELKKKYMA